MLMNTGKSGERPPLSALVVDDDPAVRELVIGLLSAASFCARGATGVADALELARDFSHLDLLICDVELEVDSGIVLAVRLKAQHPAATVVVISGRTPAAEELRTATTIGRFVPKGPRLVALLLDAIADVEAARGSATSGHRCPSPG